MQSYPVIQHSIDIFLLYRRVVINHNTVAIQNKLISIFIIGHIWVCDLSIWVDFKQLLDGKTLNQTGNTGFCSYKCVLRGPSDTDVGEDSDNCSLAFA